MLNRSNPLCYISSMLIFATFWPCCLCLGPSNWIEDATLRRFLLINLLCLIPFFQGYIRLISCIIEKKDFVSLKTMVTVGIRKRHYFIYHSDSCREDKILHQKHESYTFELLLIKLSWLDKSKTKGKVLTLQKGTFWKKTAQNSQFCSLNKSCLSYKGG